MSANDITPAQARLLARKRELTCPTSGMCGGYAQANLVILPAEYGREFEAFALNNPKPCPVLEITRGTPLTKLCGEADLRTDLPRYRIYRNGELCGEPLDITDCWQDDFWGFLLGCSFSFEEALLRGGIEVRHITMGCNVPMYKTNIATVPGGRFHGPTVVSMRPIKRELVQRACDITARFPRVHGAPLHVGDPAAIGIGDLARPDYGDPVEIRDGEVPVFWACGVTPQAAIEQCKLPFVITHAPGHMLITDLLNEELAGEA